MVRWLNWTTALAAFGFSSAASAAVCTQSNVGDLVCGAVHSDRLHTDDDDDNESSYSCANGWSQPGPEHSFEFECTYTGPVIFEMSNTDCDLDLFVLDDTCNDANFCESNTSGWSASGAWPIEIDCIAGETYHVIIEGYQIEEDYDSYPDLTMSCEWSLGFPFITPDVWSYYDLETICFEICDNGQDDDGDGQTDCDDTDCPVCAENCVDGIENDGDGLIDCEDPDCPACPEDCGNGIDDNDDQLVDCQDPQCPACVENCYDGVDNDFDNKVDCLDDDCSLEAACCDRDGDGVWAVGGICGGSDCNDTPGAGFFINPTEDDIPADGIDQNCDNVDDCYQDRDLDNVGSAVEIPGDDMICGNTDGDSAITGDCVDLAPGNGSETIYPSAQEVIGDGIDQNCDLLDDCWRDQDQDTYGSLTQTVTGVDLFCSGPFESSQSGDCLDVGVGAAAINPDATEIPADGVDQDCDFKDDCWQDSDDDNFGGDVQITGDDMFCGNVTGEANNSDDCLDSNEFIHPNADEITADGIDQDCDDKDECWRDADQDGFGSLTQTVVGVDLLCSGGFESSDSGDCDDVSINAPSVYPGASETAADGIDQNCDAKDDCWLDDDEDGYGGIVQIVGDDMICGNLTGESNTSDDCVDGDELIHPNAADAPGDGIDQDCDDNDHCYYDNDGDGYGVALVIPGTTIGCTGPNEARNPDDCFDIGPNAALVFPGQTEIPADGIDQDCDFADHCYEDLDLDGYGSTVAFAGDNMVCNADGESSLNTDCDDVSAIASTVYPHALEVPADGIDQNCDFVDTCYEDLDEDTFGSDTVVVGINLFCNGQFEASKDGDCRDEGPFAFEVNPAAEEVCDNGDNDCDNLIDEDDDSLTDGQSWYIDVDGDSYGDDEAEAVVRCSQPLFHVDRQGDCDDTEELIHPAIQETCDGIDNDCDDLIDVDDPDVADLLNFYPDNDEDGWGDASSPIAVETCEPPDGYTATPGDCDDDDEDAWPGAVEVLYDGIDQDCDTLDLVDFDEDGAVAVAAGGADCNDFDMSVLPGANESPNGIDDDCDGATDEGTIWADDDGDGFSESGGDCNDALASVHPNRPETCDGVDQNCDGVIDNNTVCFDDDADGKSENDGDCNDGDPLVGLSSVEVDNNGIDDDCDGVVDLGLNDEDGDGYAVIGGDCDDDDPDVFPGATEVANGADDDCDGIDDEGTVAYDDDNDGYSEELGDCDDNNAQVSPDMDEELNGRDDDCDGVIDEGSDFVDDDADGFSEAEGDCDDELSSVFPGATEVLNQIDDDCDGLADDGLVDVDQDGWTTEEGDCDDDDGWASPDQEEMCDHVDNDCDGEVDELCADTPFDDDPGTVTTEQAGCQGASTGAVNPAGAPAVWGLVVFALAGLRRRTTHPSSKMGDLEAGI